VQKNLPIKMLVKLTPCSKCISPMQKNLQLFFRKSFRTENKWILGVSGCMQSTLIKTKQIGKYDLQNLKGNHKWRHVKKLLSRLLLLFVKNRHAQHTVRRPNFACKTQNFLFSAYLFLTLEQVKTMAVLVRHKIWVVHPCSTYSNQTDMIIN